MERTSEETWKKPPIVPVRPEVREFTIALPFPPTGNHAVKHSSTGGHYRTHEYVSYLASVKSSVICSAADNYLSGPIKVVAEIHPPDHRRRDMDNTWKTLADAMTHAGVWKDDHQVADLRLVRREPRDGGMVVVSIEEME